MCFILKALEEVNHDHGQNVTAKLEVVHKESKVSVERRDMRVALLNIVVTIFFCYTMVFS